MLHGASELPVLPPDDRAVLPTIPIILQASGEFEPSDAHLIRRRPPSSNLTLPFVAGESSALRLLLADLLAHLRVLHDDLSRKFHIGLVRRPNRFANQSRKDVDLARPAVERRREELDGVEAILEWAPANVGMGWDDL